MCEIMNIKRLVLSSKAYLSRRWQNYIQFKCLDKLSAGEPIFVYQMGKVASSAIYHSLKKQGFCVFHAHVLNFPSGKKIPDGFEQSIEEGRVLRKKLIDQRIPLKIITLTRDPIARNISAYFQNLDLIFKKSEAHTHVSIAGLISKFLDDYDHAIPLTWFDRELCEVTGINIYEHEFPKDTGFQVIVKDNIRVLVMQVELGNEAKLDIIREFIGHREFTLEELNIASSKSYSAQYENFLSQIKLPHAYVENLLGSKYAKHFYNDSDLMRFRKKWLREIK